MISKIMYLFSVMLTFFTFGFMCGVIITEGTYYSECAFSQGFYKNHDIISVMILIGNVLLFVSSYIKYRRSYST